MVILAAILFIEANESHFTSSASKKKKTQYVCVCVRVQYKKLWKKIRVVFVSCPLCCLFCLAVTQRT